MFGGSGGNIVERSRGRVGALGLKGEVVVLDEDGVTQMSPQRGRWGSLTADVKDVSQGR